MFKVFRATMMMDEWMVGWMDGWVGDGLPGLAASPACKRVMYPRLG